MQNVFQSVQRDTLVTLTKHLCTLLETQTDDTTWVPRVRSMDPDDWLEEWMNCIRTPMTQKHAKYVRAVESITGEPPMIYHAIVYKDVDALCACKNPIDPIDIRQLVRESENATVWRFLHEMCDAAFRAKGLGSPVVPTNAQISDDIQRRKAQKKAPPVQGLTSGVNDVWRQLATERDVVCPINDEIRTRIQAFVRETSTPLSSEAVCRSFPELGDREYTSGELDTVQRMYHLVNMDDAIPTNMMRGIESVANRLVQDINNGTCDLASLDIESIGREVISGVSEGDMGNFAANLDKIMPALERMGK